MSAVMSSSSSRPVKPASAMFQQLMLPLQSVVDFFSPPAPQQIVVPAHTSSALRLAKPPTIPTQAVRSTQRVQSTGIRLVDTQMMGRMAESPAILRSRRTQDGRIVISGRMRDVCAELDRMCAD